MIEYASGIMFGFGHSICLIHKTKPEWQRGKLNFPGGKIELNESPILAVQREFHEETGYYTNEQDWTLKILLQNENWKVHFFMAKVNKCFHIKPDAIEQCAWFDWRYLPDNVIWNLRWMIPLVLDESIAFPLTINDLRPQ